MDYFLAVMGGIFIGIFLTLGIAVLGGEPKDQGGKVDKKVEFL